MKSRPGGGDKGVQGCWMELVPGGRSPAHPGKEIFNLNSRKDGEVRRGWVEVRFAFGRAYWAPRGGEPSPTPPGRLRAPSSRPVGPVGHRQAPALLCHGQRLYPPYSHLQICVLTKLFYNLPVSPQGDSLGAQSQLRAGGPPDPLPCCSLLL